MLRFLLCSVVSVWQILGYDGFISEQLRAQEHPIIASTKIRFQKTDPLSEEQIAELKEAAWSVEKVFSESSATQNRNKISEFYTQIAKSTLDVEALHQWRQDMLNHHDQLDQLIILRMSYVVESAYQKIVQKRARTFSTSPRLAKNTILQEHWDRLMAEHTKWRSHFDCIGTRALVRDPKEPQIRVRDRVYGQDNFLREVRQYSHLLDVPPSRLARIASRAAGGAVFPLLCVSAGLGCGILSIPLVVAKGTQTVGSWFHKSPVPAPAPSALMSIMRVAGGRSLRVANRENLLLDQHDPREVRLYLPPHLDEWKDMSALSALNIPNPRTFANVGIVGTTLLGKGYAGRMLGGYAAGMDGIIPVGKVKGFFRNESTESHYLRELYKPGPAYFINFSQGFVNRECIPISTRIVTGLFHPPLQLGRKLTIVPLSFHQPNTFLARSEKEASAYDRGVDVTVHTPISSDSVQKLHKIEVESGVSGLDLIPLAIRHMWYMTMQDDLSIEELESRVEVLFSETHEEQLEIDPEEAVGEPIESVT